MIKLSCVTENSRGTDVIAVQVALRMLQYLGKDGQPLEIDGICGQNTIHAINSFKNVQKAYGNICEADGVFDDYCWRLLLGY